MRHLKPIIVAAALLLFCLHPGAPPPESAAPAAPSRHEAETGSLLDRLPSSTAMAVEITGLAERWPEIQAVPALPGFLDRVLDPAGLSASDLPLLAGNEAVVALIPTVDWRSLMPVALLRPDDPEEASEILHGVMLPPGGDLSPVILRSRGILWVGPPGALDHLSRLAAGDGTSARESLVMDAVHRRLPDGGLVRGWVNAPALRAFLSGPAGRRGHPLMEALGSLLAAELEAVRFAGFRRELDGRTLTMDGVLGLDSDVLPPEVAAFLESHAGRDPVLPARLPTGTLVASAFRADGAACLAWLRYVAARNPRGPLRNLDFWMEEIRYRGGIDLERDLFGALGERGWLLIVADPAGGPPQAATILEASAPARLEEALLAVRTVLAEQIMVRSFGMVLPRRMDRASGGATVHELALWTPAGEPARPAFLLDGDHAVLATGSAALEAGQALVEEIDGSDGALRGAATPDAGFIAEDRRGFVPQDAEILERVHLDGPAIARMIDGLLGDQAQDGLRPLARAAASLLEHAGPISLAAWSRGSVIRISGVATIDPV